MARKDGTEVRGSVKWPKDRVNATYLFHYEEISCLYMVSKTYLLVTILYSDMLLLGTCHYMVLSLYSTGIQANHPTIYICYSTY